MQIVNLTPHPITLRSADGIETTYPSMGSARVDSTPGTELESIEGVACYGAPRWGNVVGLPPSNAGTIYVVSALVAGRVTGRPDVYSPGTGPNDGAIRDAQGQIKAVTRLICSY